MSNYTSFPTSEQASQLSSYEEMSTIRGGVNNPDKDLYTPLNAPKKDRYRKQNQRTMNAPRTLASPKSDFPVSLHIIHQPTLTLIILSTSIHQIF